MSKKYVLIVFILIGAACSGNVEKTMFPSPEVNQMVMQNMDYSIDTILIDTTMNTTFEGNMGVFGHQLFFIDKLLCTIHFFDSTGRITFRSLGSGHGPTETIVGQIYASTFLEDGCLCLQGVSDDVYVFDTGFHTDQTRSYRKGRKAYKPGDRIGYDEFELYSMGYPVVCRSYKNSVFTNNRSEDPTFNYFQTPDVFVKEFRNITEQKLDCRKTGRLLGKGMPPVYRGRSDTHYIFASTFFDIDKGGNFYVNFMADSLIYKYDKDYIPLYSFGFRGRDMDQDYLSIKTIGELQKEGKRQYKTKGYYTWIECIDELGYIMRSYTKGSRELSDGLQIYKDKMLIADIDVPKGFKPIGYIAPYIFSDAVVDEKNMRMYVYRLKLNSRCDTMGGKY